VVESSDAGREFIQRAGPAFFAHSSLWVGGFSQTSFSVNNAA
jgi:hypothetical protein